MFDNNHQGSTFNKPTNKRTSSPAMEGDNKTFYIQTPSGFTPIKHSDKKESDDIITPLNSFHKQNNTNTSANFSTPNGKRSLNYRQSGQVSIWIFVKQALDVVLTAQQHALDVVSMNLLSDYRTSLKNSQDP